MAWQPKLGALVEKDGVRFRVWAPKAAKVEVVLADAPYRTQAFLLDHQADGMFSGFFSEVRPGDLYFYRLDGTGQFPDPASRFQPRGVHGPSQVVDPHSFTWSDAGWRGLGPDELIIYEMHLGTLSPEGTYAGAGALLPKLVDLGVTAIELMPLADFPGQRNWGYDGVDLFAPARCYGSPDELRLLVDRAHRLGLAVLLDVVYNHLGPDGNYLGVYSPYYFAHGTEWGAGPNFDAEQHEPVREFFLENALCWINEYHFDGLRLDATHVIVDRSPRHILGEMATRLRESAPHRRVLLIAEDSGNDKLLAAPASDGGWGMDAIWADDFHHQLRRCLAGDHEGYYQDSSGTVADIALTIRQGWFYCGQHSAYHKRPRGTDPSGMSPDRFVFCIQNHDQIGNRALGERLHQQVDLATYRAATTLLLSCPQTPLLFMGQEWATSSPFQFFTDHEEDLGAKVREGRRAEFRHFTAFTDPEARARIPDPQALSTFLNSKLPWEERDREPHASMLRLYRTLLRLRRSEPALRHTSRDSYRVQALEDQAIVLQRTAPGEPEIVAVVFLLGSGTIDLQQVDFLPRGQTWSVLLTSEDAAYCLDAQPVRVEVSAGLPEVHFARPGAVLLTCRRK